MATLFSRKPAIAPDHQRSVPDSFLRRALLADEVFVGLTAVGGSIGLLINGLGMPRSVLTHSPFSNFVVPGLVLTGVGVGLLTAAWTVWQRRPGAPLASLAAGSVLLGWIVVEALMVRSGRELQIAVFACALLTIVLAWRLHQQTTE